MSKTVRALIAVTVLSALLAVWAFASSDSNDAQQAEVSIAAGPAPAPEPTRPEPEVGYDAAIARLEQGLASLRARADARETDWLTVERLAAGYMERARLTGDWGDFQRAEAELARAFERAAEGSGPHLTQAHLDYSLHRFDRVRESLRAVESYAVVTSEQRHAVKAMRADLLLQTGEYEAAEALYDELLEEDRSRGAIVGKAGVLWHTGRRAEADTLLAEAEERERDSGPTTRAWLCLARGLLALDDARLDDALAHYRRGQAIFPGWYLLEEHEAEVLTEQGETERALAMYLDLIERTDNPEFMDAAAGILESQGKRDEAAAMRARAHAGHDARVAMYPEAAFGHALGHYLEHEGDESRAVEIAEQNRDARPNGEAWTQLAEAYAGAGRLEDARAAITHIRATPYRSLALDEAAERLLASR